MPMELVLSTTMVDFPDTYQILKEASIDFQTLFLDTSTEQLVLRYKFTKHKHPMILMNCANTLDEAIDMERVVYQSMKEEKKQMKEDMAVQEAVTFLAENAVEK